MHRSLHFQNVFKCVQKGSRAVYGQMGKWANGQMGSKGIKGDQRGSNTYMRQFSGRQNKMFGIGKKIKMAWWDMMSKKTKNPTPQYQYQAPRVREREREQVPIVQKQNDWRQQYENDPRYKDVNWRGVW